MDLRLEGKVALVTGGSRGIGREVARLLASAGVDCAICGRNPDSLLQTAAALSAESGRNVVPIVADLSQPESIQSLVYSATATLGPIDILVNNGARASGSEPEDLMHVEDALILHDFEEKFLGYVRCIRAVAPGMISRNWGRMVNIGGHSARGAKNISAGARNAAVTNLSKALSVELGRNGITVNAVHPSVTQTDSVNERLSARARAEQTEPSVLLQQFAAGVAIGRLVTAEEVANVVTFLCSPLAAGITGESIAVGGGIGNAVYY